MSPAPDTPSVPPSWLEVVQAKVGRIRFESVLITVHEGRDTQVDLVEKTRIDPARAGLGSRPTPALVHS